MTYKGFGLNLPMAERPKPFDHYATPDGVTIPEGKQYAFGALWSNVFEPWQIELQLFLDPTLAPLSLEPWEHFVRAAEIFWGPHNNQANFIWNPWTTSMIQACCEYREVGLCGAASCGKSAFMSVWAILNWLADVQHTLVYITSISISSAREKIWKDVAKYYEALPPDVRAISAKVNTPTPSIFTEINGTRIEGAGIKLVSAAAGASKDSIGKLRGAKANSNINLRNGRLIFIADELSDLSHAILALRGNLKENHYFHMLAASNPNNKYDPFSLFVEPDKGWDSISVESKTWITKTGGICLHFDNLYNPNYLAGENVWNELKPYEEIQKALETTDKNSIEFWRNFRGWWCPLGSETNIYSAEEITAADAESTFGDWISAPRTRIAGLDPSFSSNGDRTILWIAEVGIAKSGAVTIQLISMYHIEVSAATETKTRQRQTCEKIIDICNKYQVKPENLGIDSTGVGDSFADLLEELWEAVGKLHKVDFRGNATELPVDEKGTRSCDKYYDRVSELWFFGKELLRFKQVYGITKELGLELTTRQYFTTKARGISQLRAEKKDQMRARTGGRSPDVGDAFGILLDVARAKFKLVPKKTHIKNSASNRKGWINLVNKNNINQRATHRLDYST